MKSFLEVLRFLLRLSRGKKYAALQLGVVVLAGLLSGLVSAAFIAVITTYLASPGDSAHLVWLFASLCLALPLLRFLSQALLVRLVQGSLLDLRLRVCRAILAAPLRRLEQLGPARILATMTEDLQAISGTIANVPMMILHLGVVVACLAYLGTLSGTLLLVFLGFVVVGLVSYQLPLIKAYGRFHKMRAAWDSLYGAWRGLTDGTKELKVHAQRRQAFLRDVIEPSARDLRRYTTSGETIFAAANSWGQSLFFIAIGLVLFALPEQWVTSSATVTGFTLVILYMMTPLDVLLNMLPDFGRAMVSIERVESLGLSLDLEHGAPTGPGEDSAPPVGWRTLELRQVSHTYSTDLAEQQFTMGPLSLRLTPGELVFLVGGNGSGKTTLAKILVGLYSPEQGEVRLDGRKIDDENRDEYRQLFSVVFSDFHLFEQLLGLLREGIDAEAKEYLKKLQLDHKLVIENGQLSTTELSQGQRKRLALLTAYLENRPIYLFDEWAADQDPFFKEVFYRQLLPELKRRGKTAIVISHDDHYYDVADRLIKLDFGQLEYDGSLQGLPSLRTAAAAAQVAVG